MSAMKGQLGLPAEPRSGDPLPHFELESVDGRWVRKGDFLGKKPLLIVFGSIT